MSLIDLFISFDGRIGRKAFWLGTGAVALCLWLLERIVMRMEFSHAAELIAFAGAFAVYPWSALAAKRATDRNRSRLSGIALVIGTVFLAMIGQALTGGASTSIFGILSFLLWLICVIDLGLMPAAPAAMALSPDMRA